MKKSIGLLILIMPLYSLAQRLHADIYAGAANYQGDLQAKRFTLSGAKPGFGIGLGYDISDHFTIRAAFSYLKISGADSKNGTSKGLNTRNLSFTSNIPDVQVALEYNLLSLQTHTFTPYLIGGGALFQNNPYAFGDNGNKVFLRPLGTEGQGLAAYPTKKIYKLTDKALIIGGGLKTMLNDNIQLGLEITVRKLFTDYLDDVSGTYADSTILANARGVIATNFAYRGRVITGQNYPAAGTDRANPRVNDLYYFTALKVSFLLGNGGGGGRRKGLGCPGSVL